MSNSSLPLPDRILSTIDVTESQSPFDLDPAVKRHRSREAIEKVLVEDLGLTELKESVAELTRHLETEPADIRADLRAAAARTLRILAALRVEAKPEDTPEFEFTQTAASKPPST
jgi:hypothetical protein